MTENAPAAGAATPARRKRWGWRTLGCLTLAIVAITVAVQQGHHTPGTLGSLALGIGGALYCTIRGVQDLISLQWYKRRLATRPDRDE